MTVKQMNEKCLIFMGSLCLFLIITGVNIITVPYMIFVCIYALRFAVYGLSETLRSEA